MLQVDPCQFASDALEDAMRLAQTKALNSYTFSDCLQFLNYTWADVYSQICMVDSGYYSKTVRLTQKLTRLPKYVRNTVMIYAAQSPMDCNRYIYRQSGETDQQASGVYRISGTDLYCPDAERTSVWLEYCPHGAQLFFTHHNRDPKLYPDGKSVIRSKDYSLYTLYGYWYDKDGEETVEHTVDVTKLTTTQEDIAKCTKWMLIHKNSVTGINVDITEYILHTGDEDGVWELMFISCDFPYIFCSWKHNITGEWRSGFIDSKYEYTAFNPFDFTGRNSNVEYVQTHWNDKTGMGVIVRDWNDFDVKLLNIDKLPSIAHTVLLVDNEFEYRASDEVAYKFSTGYWYTKYATDYNWLQVPVINNADAYTEYMLDPDSNDVVLYALSDGVYEQGQLYRYNNDGNIWELVPQESVVEVAQEQTSPRYKELGWTPDTRLVYPAPEVYRYLVARLAEKFAAMNESSAMLVASELADARFAFQAFLKKDKSAWQRMRNVNPAILGDWL